MQPVSVTVTAEVAGSSPVVPAISSKELGVRSVPQRQRSRVCYGFNREILSVWLDGTNQKDLQFLAPKEFDDRVRDRAGPG